SCRAARTPAGRRRRGPRAGGRRLGWRRSGGGRFESGDPDLDERPHLVLEARFARRRERLQERLPRLLGVDTLLEPVVSCYQQLANLFASFFVQILSFSTLVDGTMKLWPRSGF